jgi:hypothetical protein
MIAVGVAVHLLLVVRSALDEVSGESSLGLVSVSTAVASSGVVVLLGSVVGMLPAWSLFQGENLSPVLRRSDDGG